MNEANGLEKHYSITLVAQSLGVHRNTVSTLLKAKEFPGAFKVKREYRIPAADIAAFLQRRRQEGKVAMAHGTDAT